MVMCDMTAWSSRLDVGSVFINSGSIVDLDFRLNG